MSGPDVAFRYTGKDLEMSVMTRIEVLYTLSEFHQSTDGLWENEAFNTICSYLRGTGTHDLSELTASAVIWSFAEAEKYGMSDLVRDILVADIMSEVFAMDGRYTMRINAWFDHLAWLLERWAEQNV